MRVLIRQTVIVLIFLSLLIFSIKAEQLNNKFLQTRWTTDNGMPQNSVTAIVQTPDGYLWVGTFGGLARFDGVRFKIYTTSNTPELKSNRITAMTVDRNGTLWIATTRGEIILFKDGKFRLIDDGKANKNVTVIEMFADENNVIWTGSIAGLQSCTIDGCKNENFRRSISKIRQDKDGNIWILAEGKLFKFKDGNARIENIFSEGIANFEINQTGGFWLMMTTIFGCLAIAEFIRQTGRCLTILPTEK